MGNVCSECLERKSAHQPPKPGALVDLLRQSPDDLSVQEGMQSSLPHPTTVHVPNSTDDSNNSNGMMPSQSTLESPNQLAALRAEQARLALIVSDTGHDMVQIRSVRSTPGYLDQGFAAALSRLLEEQLMGSEHEHKPKNVLTSLPHTTTTSSSSSLYSLLSKSPWDTIALGTSSSGLAGCGGKHPVKYMDHIAETLVADMVPTKEQLFLNTSRGGDSRGSTGTKTMSGSSTSLGPLVENLL